jgi:heme/copper-type cytochrome/quinol oxidase subunit 2
MDHELKRKLAWLTAQGVFFALLALALTAQALHAGGVEGAIFASLGLAVAGIYGGVTIWMLLTVWKLRR